MNAHTPGPWFIDEETRPSEICTVHQTDNEQRWVYVRGALGYWSADGAENMANARMIAAAPDLLEALQKLVEACTDSNDACYGTLSTSFVANLAESAIAKATGKTL